MMKPKKTNKVHETIVKKLIESIETSGELPWDKPWTSRNTIQKNLITGNPYRGFNQLITQYISMINGYKENFWLTFKQCVNLKGTVKSGEKATPITYWAKVIYLDGSRITEKEYSKLSDEEKEECNISFSPRYYSVFNTEQCVLPEGTVPVEEINIFTKKQKISECEKIWDSYKDAPTLKHNSKTSFYDNGNDVISIPEIDQFKSSELYYGTLFHEMIHSTGHKSRLNRFKDNDEIFNNSKKSYAYEELVAEVGSFFLCNRTQIHKPVVNNTTAYLKGWLKVLKNNPSWIIKASNMAEKAVNYIVKDD